jgi:hypothetical protein
MDTITKTFIGELVWDIAITRYPVYNLDIWMKKWIGKN